MLAVLFYTLRAAEQERHTWIAQGEDAHQEAATSSDVESIPFVLPFQHSTRIQDVIGFRWPAFAVEAERLPNRGRTMQSGCPDYTCRKNVQLCAIRTNSGHDSDRR